MTRQEELDAMEFDELKDLFIKGLRKIASNGAERGLTEEESFAEYPHVAEAIDEIMSIAASKG